MKMLSFHAENVKANFQFNSLKSQVMYVQFSHKHANNLEQFNYMNPLKDEKYHHQLFYFSSKPLSVQL